LEIGVDCVDITRFKDDIVSKSRILEKIFTENEIRYCEDKMNSYQHYAVRFAGKESVIKAFAGYGIELSLRNIEILNTEQGVPYVNVLDEEIKGYDVKISLSHTYDIAVAFVIVSKEPVSRGGP